ncbi:30S ribosomal protein S13 [archaeon]|jgi:small subunit ribosomal protein S13|nr:30S ribosomal protein S13 [archaeon]MBT3730589.1 30S ribosomal protein S13 [archaeon]MBT4669491.1 30S ribosomal protein S13 [archaeon]MBT5030248.1 30S ribosomal protein S13 [archaeon]MBT5287653.1 30S ribosomal protein S13 [archaeon]
MTEGNKIIVRLMNTDLKGNSPISKQLSRIKGIGQNFANAFCIRMKINPTQKVNTLPDADLKKIEAEIKDPKCLTPWFLNRQKDYDSGSDTHLSTAGLNLQLQFDQKRIQKTKTYRGLRKSVGLPVRGQRTKANFRKGKTVGVSKKKGKK